MYFQLLWFQAAWQSNNVKKSFKLENSQYVSYNFRPFFFLIFTFLLNLFHALRFIYWMLAFLYERKSWWPEVIFASRLFRLSCHSSFFSRCPFLLNLDLIGIANRFAQFNLPAFALGTLLLIPCAIKKAQQIQVRAYKSIQQKEPSLFPKFHHIVSDHHCFFCRFQGFLSVCNPVAVLEQVEDLMNTGELAGIPSQVRRQCDFILCSSFMTRTLSRAYTWTET